MMKKIKYRLILFIGFQLCVFRFPLLCYCVFPAGEFLVQEVIDGDTIKLANGEIVRYLGIDTSELRWHKGGSWIYHPQPFANEAKNYNISLVEGNIGVRLTFRHTNCHCEPERRGNLAFFTIKTRFPQSLITFAPSE